MTPLMDHISIILTVKWRGQFRFIEIIKHIGTFENIGTVQNIETGG